MTDYKRDPHTVSNASGVLQPTTLTVDAEEYRQLKRVVVAAAMWRGARVARLGYAGACNRGEAIRDPAYAQQLLREDDELERAFIDTMDKTPPALLRRLGIEALGEYNERRRAEQTPAAS